MMERRILQTIVALLAIVSSATAQTLSVASIEAKTGEQAELVVSTSGMSGVTALQFNLTLPQGVTLNENAITKGSAVSSHELKVETLANGDRLFVLYNMDLGLVNNGTLLKLPITIGQQTGSFSGSLSTIRTASTGAVSHECANASFSITVKAAEEELVTITADNKSMTYGDDVPALTYTSTGAALSGTPTLSTTATKTSPVGSYPIKVEKGTVTNNNVTYVDGTLTITKAPLTVGVQNVTITEGDVIPTFTLTYSGFRNGDTENTAFTTKPEGDVIPTFTLTYSGFRNGDTENTAFTTKPVATTTAVALSKAGTYPITVSGGEAKNYALSYTQGTLTIKEKVVDPVTSGELVINGSLSGHDLSCFYARENCVEDNTIVHATIGVRSGKDRTRGIVVQSTNNPPEIWNTQFFVRLPQTLPAGTKYRFSFDYKATQNADVNMECHKEPSEFIYWDFGSMSFTTSWKHYESEGIITSEQSPNNNQMRTIAFNLSHISTATTYYFDNISFIINPTTGIGDVMADDSTNGVVYNLSGQKLSKPKKGINIVNGRKVVVK